jgi:hypothetical protein
MPITTPDRIAGWFASMRPDDLDALTPAERRRFADICRQWAEWAEPRKPDTKSCVPFDLRTRGAVE